MSSRVTHDLCVAVGTYQSSGETKKKWLKVGIEMETDKGGRFLLLDRTFNPAGVPDPENRGTVMVSLFDPKDRGEEPPRKARPQDLPIGKTTQAHESAQLGNGFTDDIPF